jgi:hypothetical protein
MNLFFVGDEFYKKSASLMSSIYHVRTGTRSNWGEVDEALRNGETVTIRPATTQEMTAIKAVLFDILKEQRERENN